MQAKAVKGHALSEYGFLVGLLMLLIVACLSLLGSSIADLFQSLAQGSTHNAVGNYLTSTLGNSGGSAWGNASGNPGNPQSPATQGGSNPIQLPSQSPLAGASPISVNVSSVDGNDQTVLGSLRLAAYLDQLAQSAINPTTQSYYAQLAQLAYYMGANEGKIDNFDVFTNISGYTNGDALNDLVSKSAEFKSLMANPPATLGSTELVQVMPVIQQVSTIADNYLQNLHSLLNSDAGKVYYDFTVDNSGGSSAIHTNPVTPTFTSPLKNASIDSLVPYDHLKLQANAALNSHPIQADSTVLNTFTDAKTTDGQTPNY